MQSASDIDPAQSRESLAVAGIAAEGIHSNRHPDAGLAPSTDNAGRPLTRRRAPTPPVFHGKLDGYTPTTRSEYLAHRSPVMHVNVPRETTRVAIQLLRHPVRSLLTTVKRFM